MKYNFLSSAAVISVAVLFATSASAQSVTVLGGGLKGGAYAMAVGLSKVLKDKAGINVSPQTSGGMVAQARLLAKGDAQFAFGIGGAIGAWAYNGQRRFEKEGPKKNLRAVAAYPFGHMQWVTLANSKIKTLSDVKGMRVSVGKASSLTQTFGRILMRAHGVGKGDVKESTPGFSGGFKQLRDGNVDAHLTAGRVPVSSLREMATSKEFRLIQMDKGILDKLAGDIGSGVNVEQIQAGVYGKNQKNTGPVNTLAMYFGYTTSTHVSADLVYKITKATFDNLAAYKKGTPKAKGLTLAGACSGLAFPLHEGALRYYKEKGVKGCK
jgi:uncharacterized protein